MTSAVGFASPASPTNTFWMNSPCRIVASDSGLWTISRVLQFTWGVHSLGGMLGLLGRLIIAAWHALHTLCIVCLFLKNNETKPVVKASGRELSYILLIGVLLCYCITFIYISKPSGVVVHVTAARPGNFPSPFATTLPLYWPRPIASLGFSTALQMELKGRGSSVQLRRWAICAALISCQLLVVVVWLLVEAPGVRKEGQSWKKRRGDIEVQQQGLQHADVFNLQLCPHHPLYLFTP